MSRLELFVALCAACVLAACERSQVPPLPSVMVWAWDRAEDLRFLATEHDVGVAYLAATIELRGATSVVHRRRGSLQLAPTTMRMPVVRLEPSLIEAPTLDDTARSALLRAIRAEYERAALGRIQIDFEAPVSARPFYAALLRELRHALGSDVPISVTALSSWCLDDRWMSALPVDEIVPMFYRLGEDARSLRFKLMHGGDLAPECRHAHGYITDEPTLAPPTPRRSYLFSTLPWQKAAFERERRSLDAGGSS